MSDTFAHRKSLHALVERHTRSFPVFEPVTPVHAEVANPETTAVVLLSGSTGAFGANILAELVMSPAVVRAYAVSRPGKDDVFERHAEALRREGIDPAILHDKKIRLVEADLSTSGFGVDDKLYEELRASVTHIIHNGWKVNFNAPVSEFESNILSVRNLVDFSLCTRARSDQPTRLIFISSIGMFQNVDPLDPDKVWPEEHLEQPDCTFGLGYAEAKWVSEHILYEAKRHTALQPTIVRLGQIVGGPGGYWSETDWFPILIKSSIALGMLPAVPGVFSWNRSHIKARALIDMLETKELYVHLVNPKPIPETALIAIFARKLGLPIVYIDDWMVALQRSYNAIVSEAPKVDGVPSRDFMRQAFRKNPAARMVGFFRQVQESCRGKPLRPDQTTACTPLVGCVKAVAASRTLRDPGLPQVGEEDVSRWIENWKAVGFLNSNVDERAWPKAHL